jgi:two-component system, OmpR family, phosphate regulon sensor histidine kinase PhoR
VVILAFVLGLAIGLVGVVFQQQRIDRLCQQLLVLLGDSGAVSYAGISQHTIATRLVGSAQQQQYALQQLQETIQSYRQLLYQAPLPFLQVDREDQLIWCNASAIRLLRIEPPNIEKPRLLIEWVRSYDLDRLVEETRRSQLPCQREWVMHSVAPNPENPVPQQMMYFQGQGLPLSEGQIGVFLIDRRELVELTQQRDRWVSDVAHELKTPLTSIRLVAETIMGRVDPEVRPWMERLMREVINLSNLVHDLLDLSRLERRVPQTLNITRVDLAELVQSAWQSLEPITEQNHIGMIYVGPDSAIVEGDRPRLYRVILNLLDNAIKYSCNAEVIEVHLSIGSEADLAPEIVSSALDAAATPGVCTAAPVANRPTTHVILDVIDYGAGFPEQALPHVFERFYRADPSRAKVESSSPLSFNPVDDGETDDEADDKANNDAEFDSQSGPPSGSQPGYPFNPQGNSCGLGLAIVQQIVIAHRGSVTVQNHPTTHGGWVQVCLPCGRQS